MALLWGKPGSWLATSCSVLLISKLGLPGLGHRINISTASSMMCMLCLVKQPEAAEYLSGRARNADTCAAVGSKQTSAANKVGTDGLP